MSRVIPWDKDEIQFPRLLAEINATGLTAKQYKELSISMDLSPNEINEILGRATEAFDEIKSKL